MFPNRTHNPIFVDDSDSSDHIFREQRHETFPVIEISDSTPPPSPRRDHYRAMEREDEVPVPKPQARRGDYRVIVGEDAGEDEDEEPVPKPQARRGHFRAMVREDDEPINADPSQR
jgi:hypothetical protein